MNSEPLYLDVLGQAPRINRLYTNLSFCFELQEDNVDTRSRSSSTLKRGAERLSKSFPWVTGKVCYQGGKFMIQPAQDSSILIEKNFTNDPDFPTWSDLSKADFPFSMLNEELLARCQTLATADATTTEQVVFRVQATWIRGGKLLTFSGQHGSMDFAGLCQLIYLYSKACRDESFTSAELEIGNGSRRDTASILESEALVDTSQDKQLARSGPNEQPQESKGSSDNKEGVSPPAIVWAYFNFSSSALKSLKESAMSTLIQGTFVSTDDILTAFLWLSISRARAPRLLDTSLSSSTLSRNVDMRHHLALPPTYPGLMVESTVHTTTIAALLELPLGQVAVQLRSALDGPALVRQYNSKISNILHNQDNDGGGSGASGTPELEVRLSSWSKEKCSDFDFGFGRADAVRRPAFLKGARDGLVYLLPRTTAGDIPVAVCLRQDDLERLKEDPEFVRYSAYIG